jgi:putative membrane protein
LVSLGVLVVVALGVSALMGGVMGPGMAGQGPVGPAMMPGHGWMWGLGVGLGGVVMLTFWGALILGIVLLIRSMGAGGGPQGHSTPLDTLERRYAAGDITREQYELMRKDLDQQEARESPADRHTSTADVCAGGDRRAGRRRAHAGGALELASRQE